MNAVIYARHSSDSQREESIEGQFHECTDYAERNGMTIVGSYIDRALSAKTADRPEFQQMIRDSAKGLFEIVLVWKFDRFSRDRYDSAHYKHILKKNGVKVVSAKEHISDGPKGIILESMLEGYAEFYSAELSEKIHRGQKENALKGKNNGGGIPLGYLLDKQTQKLIIDPETAPLVVEIFERYSEGATVRSIIEDFNSRGLTTKRGKPFNMNSFNALLKNRKYIGEYSYQDVVIPGGVPAIVPEDLFYRVQQRMEKNKRAPAMAKAREDFLLTTKLFCGKCERMMVGESGKSHTGAMHYYYKCGNAKRKKGCDKKAVKKDWIERAVVRLTMERVLNKEKISKIIDALLVMQEREDVTIPALRHQLAETEKGIENMLNAIQQGIFTTSTKQRLEELEKQREDLSISITTAELQKPKLTREYMEHWFSQFRYGNPNDRDFQKRLVDTFVNSVYVYDDKLVLTYNYKHVTQIITLKEVEDFLGSDLGDLSPPPKRERFSPLPFFSFYAAFRPLHLPPNKAAKAPRSRSPVSRRGRRTRKRPDRPQSGAAAGILCASVGMSVQRTAGGARRAVRPPSVSSPCGSSIPPAAVTPHAAKKFICRLRPFSRRYSLRAPLDDNHDSRKPDGENAGAQTSGRRDTAQRTLSRADNSRRTALPNARSLERTLGKMGAHRQPVKKGYAYRQNTQSLNGYMDIRY